MKRMQIQQVMLAITMLVFSQTGMCEEMKPQSMRSTEIKYINPIIPSIKLPPYEGERYEVLVPDTLDIEERINYAVHSVSSIADPKADYEIWGTAIVERNPPVLLHNFDGFQLNGKVYESLPLMRRITGNIEKLEVDQRWAEVLIQIQGEDGLLYAPVKGRPWARLRTEWFDEYDKEEFNKAEQFASISANAFGLRPMGLYYQLYNEDIWIDRTHRLIDALSRLMVYRDDYCYYPITVYTPGMKISQEMDKLDIGGEAGGVMAGWLISSLCQAYRATGYQPAIELAGKLAVYLKEHSGTYDEQGRFLLEIHPHIHLKPLLGLLEYAVMTNNREILAFCRKGYEYAKLSGNTTVGYFPGIPSPQMTINYNSMQFYSKHYYVAEGCTAADMVALAISLSQAGVGDYWDDADRYVRNHFAEIQILKRHYLERNIASLAYSPPNDFINIINFENHLSLQEQGGMEAAGPLEAAEPLDVPHINTETETVIDSLIGGCFSNTNANDIKGGNSIYCCSANYSRALCYLWGNILNNQNGTIRVNLLLNRTSPWIDIYSYIPYEGQVDFRVKKSCKLMVRIPEWVKSEETLCTIGGKVIGIAWQGRYADIGEVKSDTVVTFKFPIAERIIKERMDGQDFTITIKGNTVVSIDPPGEHYPLYERSHYREKQTRWVKRTRFISSKPLPEWHY